MDYKKIDASLAAVLGEIQDPEQPILAVFIYTTHSITAAEATFLEKLGVREGVVGKQLITATLSARAVSELSDQQWVKHLKLSRKLRLLN